MKEILSNSGPTRLIKYETVLFLTKKPSKYVLDYKVLFQIDKQISSMLDINNNYSVLRQDYCTNLLCS